MYDWKKIFEAAEGMPSSCILIIRMMTEGLIPRNKKDPIYKYFKKDYFGSSFLLHPDVLLANRYKYEPWEVAQYLALASLRSVANYFAYRDTTLDLLHVNVDRELFNTNRLLHIDGDRLHFLYEEVPQEKH
jgi:hypothetical protein